MKPARLAILGETVHYVPQQNSVEKGTGNEILPAVITEIYEGQPSYQNGEVNLTVFLDNDQEPYIVRRTTVAYDSNNGPGTWHFPFN